jgi:outer membrane receptor protein involved in Fe transport
MNPPLSRRRAWPSQAATALATLAIGLATVADAADAPLEEIVVTATRRPANALTTPLSLDAVGSDTIALVGATHHSETMNRIAGVMIQRGIGQ